MKDCRGSFPLVKKITWRPNHMSSYNSDHNAENWGYLQTTEKDQVSKLYVSDASYSQSQDRKGQSTLQWITIFV